jgi:hypothetical protein
MTNQLTEELVHWELADPPDGAGVPEDDADERVESPSE